jgi:hypothetical protein
LQIRLVFPAFATIYPIVGESMPATTKDILMTQDKQPQDVLEAEKPATPPADQPAKKNDADRDQPKSPQAEGDGGAQPMAHPPEDTFVGTNTHPRPGKSGS